MPIITTIRIAVIAGVLCIAGPALAGASTSQGQISVSQVMEMLDKAPTNPTARQVLTAYLAGLGETASAMIDASTSSAPRIACKSRLQLDASAVRRTLEAVPPATHRWDETPATPIIVRDLIQRAGCRAMS